MVHQKIFYSSGEPIGSDNDCNHRLGFFFCFSLHIKRPEGKPDFNRLT
jgi:hypothetical protein